uniref:THAP-type domain-containing protein n=1 Tax=Xenopus tropicalis TaxID=8364 RepID=A0A803KFX0_XENTR
MPNCIVKGCPHRSGQKLQYPDVVLHPFPRNIHQIKNWLMQTGQHAGVIDTLSDRILQGTKNSSFRMCSQHFTPDCYMMQGSRRFLKPNAVPTIFASIPVPVVINVFESDTTLPSTKRKRVDNEQPSTSSQLVRIVSRLVTVATQTEIITKTCATMTSKSKFSRQSATQTTGTVGKEISTQTEEVFYADVNQLRKDHTYPVCFSTPVKSMQPTCDIFSASPIAPTLQPLENLETPSKDLGSQTAVSGRSMYVQKRNFIIYEENLDDLFKLVKCQHSIESPCQAPIIQIKKTTEGSMLKVQLICLNGHDSFKWMSQPMAGATSIGNVALANSIVLSGSTYTKVKDMFNILNVPFYSHTSFYRYQREYIFPAIDKQWQQETAAVKTSLSGQSVALAGDGQFDSPGHSAKYCTYTTMDLLSKKIVHFEIQQLGTVKNSYALEQSSFTKCLQTLLDEKVKVKILATDRHSGIRALMKSKFKKIDHQFDVWHLCKSIQKKLLAASKKRKCRDIAHWINAITNHLWWSSQTCKQNVNVLLAKWKSVLFHVANKHTFKSLKYYKKCQHRRLTAAQKKDARWIGCNHPAHSTLKEIINDRFLLRDIAQTEKFCHTGDLENFHSKVLKYKPKRISFKMDAMIARTSLGALSHNRNVHRHQAVVKRATKTSLAFGEKRFKIVFPKMKKDWIAKPVYEDVIDEHLLDITSDSIKILTGEIGHDWVSISKQMPQNIATTERPEKSEVIEKHMSRFSRC